MKVIAHCGENTFMIQSENKYYLIKTRTNKILKVENPDEIYRQGYWKNFEGNLDKTKENIIQALLKTTG